MYMYNSSMQADSQSKSIGVYWWQNQMWLEGSRRQRNLSSFFKFYRNRLRGFRTVMGQK